MGGSAWWRRRSPASISARLPCRRRATSDDDPTEAHGDGRKEIGGVLRNLLKETPRRADARPETSPTDRGTQGPTAGPGRHNREVDNHEDLSRTAGRAP